MPHMLLLHQVASLELQLAQEQRKGVRAQEQLAAEEARAAALQQSEAQARAGQEAVLQLLEATKQVSCNN